MDQIALVYGAKLGFALLLATAASWPLASRAAAACPATTIVTPALDDTITEVRPTIRWQSVSGAVAYRIELTSRQPEGAALASIDTVVSDTSFVPPNALAVSTTVVRVSVIPQCRDGPTNASKRATVHRFFIDARSTCKLPEIPSV